MKRITIGFFNIEFPSNQPFKKTKSFLNGGAGKSLLDLILNLNNKKYFMTIFSLGNSKAIQYEYHKPNLELYRYPPLRLKLFKKISILQKILSPKFILNPLQKKVDLIHCQLGYFGADLAALVYKHYYHIPLLLSIRGIPKIDWKKFHKRMIMNIYMKTIFKKILKISDIIIVQSESVIKDSELLFPFRDKIEIIPNGVDFNRFSTYNTKKINDIKFSINFRNFENILLFVGSLSERKGIPILIDAYEKLLKFYPNTLLIIVGTGLLDSYIIKQSKKENFQKKILLTGYIQDKELLAKIYSIADLLILPSTDEGFPRVLLESMAAGTPCLVSDINTNIEVLDKGRLGLIAKKNNPNDFAKKIIEFLKMDESNKKYLKDEGIVFSKKHSWSSVALQMEKIYDKLSRR